MMSRLITLSADLTNFWVSRDEELDAALILAGQTNGTANCTIVFKHFLERRYAEYKEHQNHYILWMLRNPASVIYSMVYNWKRFALNELFINCGLTELTPAPRFRVLFQRKGASGFSKVRQACYAYNGKVKQLDWLVNNYSPQRLVVIEYDHFVATPDHYLENLFKSLKTQNKH